MPLSCIGCFRYIYKIHGCRCPELAGISISEVGGDVSSMNKVLVNSFFSEVFAPRRDETCRCAVLRSYYCTTARVPYCVCRCSEQCPCLPANGHPRPISRCLAEDYTCPSGLTLTELWRAASGVLYSSVHNSQPQIRVTIRHRPTGTWEHSFLAV